MLSQLRTQLLSLCFLISFCISCKPRGSGSEFEAASDGPISMFPVWKYDEGPNPNPNLPPDENGNKSMGRDLIDINSEIPYFPGISNEVYGDQMFRPAYGPIPWRMMQEPNSVKILFIGQDGTHIAEAAGRPATAGFGGRAQDLAKYFGVASSAAFINTFAFTIKWQYGAFDTPIIKNKNGTPELSFGSFTGNQVWLISQDQESPIVQWRNRLIEWIIRNNQDSLKLIVLFGGAARDAAASFVVANGGSVNGRFYNADQLKDVEIPEYKLIGAGGNQQTAVPLSPAGEDLFAQQANDDEDGDHQDDDAQAEAQGQQRNTGNTPQNKMIEAFKANPSGFMKNTLVLTHNGLNGSGMIHPAQLGGYDIGSKMFINNKQTISLKDFKLKSGFKIKNHILVAELPHPTALTKMWQEDHNKPTVEVKKRVDRFEPYVRDGWKIEPDKGFVNSFAAGKKYVYGRGDMGTEYYDFGAPNSRMVNVSSASRLTHKDLKGRGNVIVFGTRDKVNFDIAKLNAMTFAKPAEYPPEEEMWTTRPTSLNRRYIFDPGPGEKYAKIMKTELPKDSAFLKKLEINGDFAHYRGTFKNPKVLILADPDGDDDLITSRALTGARGQYLHGLMNDIGVDDRYLVIKTAPYTMYEEDAQDWSDIMEATQDYRSKLLKEIMSDNSSSIKMIIADGKTAMSEIKRIFPNSPVPVIELKRNPSQKDAGIEDAIEEIKKVPGFAQVGASGAIANIPRTHLPYYARVWEGTSGDRVITSPDARYRGKAFAEVAPEWAYGKDFKMVNTDLAGIAKLKATIERYRLRRGEEPVQEYLRRVGR